MQPSSIFSPALGTPFTAFVDGFDEHFSIEANVGGVENIYACEELLEGISKVKVGEPLEG